MNKIVKNTIDRALGTGMGLELDDTLTEQPIFLKTTSNKSELWDEVVKLKITNYLGVNKDMSELIALLISLAKDFSYKPKNTAHLKRLIKQYIKLIGNDCNLNWLDVSNIENMSRLFKNSPFIGDISEWDTSKVSDMSEMFYKSKFNGNLSKWKTPEVLDMSGMFLGSMFNNDSICNWDVRGVTDMSHIFQSSKFDHDLSNWKLNSVKWMKEAFKDANYSKSLDFIDRAIFASDAITFYFRLIFDNSKLKLNVRDWFDKNIEIFDSLDTINTLCPFMGSYIIPNCNSIDAAIEFMYIHLNDLTFEDFDYVLTLAINGYIKPASKYLDLLNTIFENSEEEIYLNSDGRNFDYILARFTQSHIDILELPAARRQIRKYKQYVDIEDILNKYNLLNYANNTRL